MNLLDSMRCRCARLEKTEMPDGLGGFSAVWTEGEGFDAVLIRKSAGLEREAQREALKETFVVLTAPEVGLRHPDVFRRLSDGATFRVTTANGDEATPEEASIRAAKALCERWELT